ncbi:hypothetical protein FRC03_011600, partial [Tulasnella sp. 419]
MSSPAPIYSATQLEQSWFFDWNPLDNPNPPPVTRQCETLRINWRRPPATGPDAIGPYFLKVFTSIHTTPFTVPLGDAFNYEFTVPFPPGTLYQLCMFDSVGNTGGCQGIYTVIDAAVSQPSCANITAPAQLTVKTATSQTGWPAQCSYLELNGLQGTPPYTFIAAPSLRPPTVINNIGGDGLRWQIPYNHASPFFIGLTDSTGRAWSWGPMHAGDGPDTSCLDYKHTIKAKGGIPVGAVIGAAVGALVVGAIIGFLFKSLWSRRQRKTKNESGPDVLQATKGSTTMLHPTPYSLGPAQPELGYVEPQRPVVTGGSDVQRPTLRPLSDHTETYYEDDRVSALSGPSRYGNGQRTQYSSGARSPTSMTDHTRYSMAMTDENRRVQYGNQPGILPDGTMTIDPREATRKTRESYGTQASGVPPSPSIQPGRASQVYVIHQDSGRAPVSIVTDNATQVVELPPQYVGGSHPAE